MQSPAAHSMPTAWTKSLGKASDLLFRCTINALCAAHAEQHALVHLVEEYIVVNHDTLARMAEYARTAAHEELHAKVYLKTQAGNVSMGRACVTKCCCTGPG